MPIRYRRPQRRAERLPRYAVCARNKRIHSRRRREARCVYGMRGWTVFAAPGPSSLHIVPTWAMAATYWPKGVHCKGDLWCVRVLGEWHVPLEALARTHAIYRELDDFCDVSSGVVLHLRTRAAVTPRGNGPRTYPQLGGRRDHRTERSHALSGHDETVYWFAMPRRHALAGTCGERQLPIATRRLLDALLRLIRGRFT